MGRETVRDLLGQLPRPAALATPQLANICGEEKDNVVLNPCLLVMLGALIA
jgi:hypothetical protein